MNVSGVIQIGHSERESLVIEILERSNPTAIDWWEGNWLKATVTVNVVLAEGALNGQVRGLLRSNELAVFQNELAELYSSLTGTARFSTMDRWLALELRGNGRGQVAVIGQLSHNSVSMNMLRFEMGLDQTYLPEILTSLHAVLTAYPVIGQP
jgi:hypothetical protein